MNTDREVADREVIEKLDAVGRVKMPTAKQQELWRAIDARMHQSNALGSDGPASERTRRGVVGTRSGVLGTSAAAVAAVAILGGGFYAWSQHGLTSNGADRGNPGLAAGSNVTAPGPGNAAGPGGTNGGKSGATASGAIAVPTSFQSISVADSSPAAIWWSPAVFTQTEAKVKSLFKGAVVTTVHIPTPPSVSFNANTNPATLNLVGADGQHIIVAPAHYTVAGAVDQNGHQTYHQKYINGVISYKVGGQVTYLRDQSMYDWLKNGQWKSTFQVGISANKTQYSNAQLAAMTAKQLAAYNIKYQQALPFASGDVTRNVPAQLLLVSNPKSGSILGSSSFSTIPAVDATATHSVLLGRQSSNQFQVVDRWTGSVGKQSFAVEVDRKTDGSAYVVAVARGPMVTAYLFNQRPFITNFSGSYLVLTTSNPAKRNPYYALNLQTGGISGGRIASELSSDYLTMGANSNEVLGLPQTYKSLPVIGGQRY